MNARPIPEKQGFAVSPETRSSFGGNPSFYELSGPGALVRLVQFSKSTYDGLKLKDSRISGDFWFAEELLLRLRETARRDLMQQQTAVKRPFSTSLPVLIGNYVRHCLRLDLAISKDWTNDFDAFVCLRLQPEDRLTALVGSVARQPAYSKAHPSHDMVTAKNIWLDGGATQYVVDFGFPANRLFVGRILGPFSF